MTISWLPSGRTTSLVPTLLLLLCAGLTTPSCTGGDGATLEVTISADPVEGGAPLMVQFNGQVEGEGQGAQYDFLWRFGDGAASRLRNPVHTYVEPGSYQAELVVQDQTGGGSGTAILEITVLGEADLVAGGISFDPPEIPLRETITLSFWVKNIGSEPAEPSVACVHLSETALLEGDNIHLLAEVEIGALEAGGEERVEDLELLVEGRLPTRNYWVAVEVDCHGAVEEMDETNNVALAADRLRVVSPDDAPDLEIASLRFSPHTTFPGKPLRVEMEIRNEGTRRADPFQYQVFLSRDESLDEDDDLLVGEGMVDEGLLAETGVTVNESLDLPDEMEDGSWFVIGLVDGADEIDELDEGNNVKVSSGRLTILDGQVDGIDLVPVQIGAGAYQVPATGTVHVLAAVCNRGTRNAPPFSALFTLSEDQQYDGDDALLGTVNFTSGMGPGLDQCKDVSFVQALGPRVTPGQYHLCMMVDPYQVVPEVSRENNWICDNRRIAVGGTTSIDLAVSEVDFSPDELLAGQSLSVQFRVENLSNSPASAFDVLVAISEHPRFDGEVRNLEVFQVSRLDAEEGLDFARTVPVPLDLDARLEHYYVIVVADPWKQLVLESDRSNNTAIAPRTVRVTGGMGGCRPDVWEPNDTIGQATRIGAGFHEDLGRCGRDDWYAVSIRSGFGLRAAIDFSPTRGALGLELYSSSGTQLLDRSLRPGTNRESVALPVSIVDSVYYLRVVGSPSTVENMYDLDLQVVQPVDGVDLAAGTITPARTTFNRGVPLPVGMDVSNLGEQAAGPFQVSFSLIASDGDQGDGVEVKRVSFPDGLAGLSTEPLMVTLSGPESGLVPGDYRVVAVVDPEDETGDTERDNNRNFSRQVTWQEPPAGCLDDAFDPNESPATAAPLSPGFYQGLFVCRDFDDWYALDLHAGDQVNLRAFFLHEDGDIDMELFGPGRGVVPLAHGRSSTDGEGIDHVAEEDGVYLVRLFLHSGPNSVNGYRLLYRRSQCVGDRFEPNDRPGEAAPLTGAGLEDLTMCIDDVDYFMVELMEGTPVVFVVSGDGGEGDGGEQPPLSMELIRPEPGLLGDGDGGGENGAGGDHDHGVVVASADGELGWSPEADGLYLLRVWQSDGLVVSDYGITVQGLSGIDLTVGDLRVSSSVVQEGDPMDVSFTIRNRRADPVPPFGLRIAVADGAVPQWDDEHSLVLVDGLVEDGLAPGEVFERTVRVYLPSTVGTGSRYLAVLAEPLPEELHVGTTRQHLPITVRERCEPDRFEPNNTPASATALVPGVYTDLTICRGDIDYYMVGLDQVGTLHAAIRFNHDLGELDLYVLDMMTLDLLAISSTGSDDEEIRLEELEPGGYLVVVVGVGDVDNGYSLELSFP